MKNTLYAGIALILAMGVYVYWNIDKNEIRPDSVENAAFLIAEAIQFDSYDFFKRYFVQGTEENVTKAEFDEMHKVMTNGYDYMHFSAIKLSNGEILLMRINKDQQDGLYKASDVIKVPKDMQSLFE